MTTPAEPTLVPAGRAPARLSIVVAIPAFNEEISIGSVVLRAKAHAAEVVVVDDGSTDATADVAAMAGARVVRHASNGGYGEALRTIFRLAREEQWPALAILDSDGQHDPRDLPEVAGPVLAGRADVAVGSRFLEPETSSDVPGYRKVGIKILTEMSNVGASKDARLTDGQSGFRAYSRRAIAAIAPRDADMGVSAEILFQARKAGCTFEEVPIRVRYDVDGSSQGPVKHGLGVVRSILRYAEVEHPFAFFGIPALFLLVAGAVLAFLVAGGALATFAGALGAMLMMLGVLALSSSVTLHAVRLASAPRGESP